MKRVLLSALLGALAMFVWSSIAHVLLPLGETGFKEIPVEANLISAMRTGLGDSSGLYLFPGLGLGPHPSSAQKNAALAEYDKKLANSPSGLLLYHPPGEKSMTASRMVAEFLKEFALSLLVVLVLWQTGVKGYMARVGVFALIGLAAAISTNISYWNWYGFPLDFTLAAMSTSWIGFTVAGLAASKTL